MNRGLSMKCQCVGRARMDRQFLTLYCCEASSEQKYFKKNRTEHSWPLVTRAVWFERHFECSLGCW